MRATTLSLALSFLGIFFCQLLYAQSWMPVGPNDTNKIANTSSYADMVVNKLNGDVLIAYFDPRDSLKLTVRKYDGTKWSVVGNRGITTAVSEFIPSPAITVNDSNIIYVLYSDPASGRATVQKYDGSAWHIAGIEGFSRGGIVDYAITVDTNGYPYIIYADRYWAQKAVVKKYDGSSWTTVGVEGFSNGKILWPNIIINKKTNRPVVAYVDSSIGNKIVVKEFNDTSWVNMGYVVSDTMASHPTLAADSNGHLYIAYNNFLSDQKLEVMTFNDTAWVPVGSQDYYNSPASKASLIINPSGVLYVLYQNRMAKYNGTNWLSAADSINIQPYLTIQERIECTHNGVIYAGFINTIDFQYKVYKLTDTTWERLDTSGISDGIATNPDIATDTANDAYVTYKMSHKNFYIKKFASGLWKDISPKITTSNYSLDGCKIAINKVTNEPYIAYADSNDRLSVKKYSSGSWHDVGTPYSRKIRSINFVIDHSGKPIIDYVDDSVRQATLIKFDGTNWLAIDSNIGYPIALDENDTLYALSYTNVGNLILKYYNGISWIPIRDSIIIPSMHYAYNSLIAIGNDHTPYIAYSIGLRSTSSYNTILVMKFNGVRWVSVGTPIVSYSGISLASLFMDKSNRPIITYTNANNTTANTQNYISTLAKRFNGADWEYIGDSAISTGDAYAPAFSLSKNNTLFCAYQNSNNNEGGEIFVREYQNLPTDTSTSVRNIAIARPGNMYAYPNPCTSYVTIKGWDAAKDGDQLYIYDVSGRLVRSVTTYTNRINTANWPSGVYFLQTYSGQMLKIIKQ